MKTKLTRLMTLASILAAATAAAQGVPQNISFTANLSSSGLPATGMHGFIFTLYDAATGGTSGWVEMQPLQVNNGLVFARLGTSAPLTPAILNGAPLWLEVSIDGTTLSPRAPIASVPYAIRAGVANTAESIGSLLAGQVQKRIIGSCTGANAIQSIDVDGGVGCVSIAAGTGDITAVNTSGTSGLIGGATTGNVDLSLASCPLNQVLKSTGAGWSCQADNTGGTGTVTSITAGAGMTGGAITTSGTIGIAPSGVTNGMLANSSVTVNAGPGLSGGGAVSLGGATQLSVDSTIVARKDLGAGPQNFLNRVGIGVPLPATQLDVAGDIQGTGFKFAAPVAGSLIVHPTACVRLLSGSAPDFETNVYIPNANTIGPSIAPIAGTANSSPTWYCPVNLPVPPGAVVTITGAMLGSYDSSPNCRVTAELRIKAFGTAGGGSLLSTGFSGASLNDFLAAPNSLDLSLKPFPFFTQVISATDMIWVAPTIAFDTVGAGASACRFAGAQINYTVDRP